MQSRRLLPGLLIAAIVLFGCSKTEESALKIDYESFTLDNGLEVVFHEDRSDPITAIAVLFHVGSGREVVGRTGFAHLFEHMLFQQSQHVGQDQFFKKIQAAGGTLNGGTSFDRTIYFEVVPKNALEMALWLESDRMGFLLSTVDQEAFENQQSIVQNEKRQRVDNVPYGHTGYVINKLLYPEEHSYNWQVIGSFEDLKNASLEDVRSFYTKWYGPNNATLVIAGDFDKVETRALVEKYFGEIKSSDPVPNPVPKPVKLATTKKVYYEDNFARSPELNMVFPTVENFHQDSYALELIGELLSDGKKAPLYQILVEDKKLAPSVSAYQSSLEIAGTFRIRIRAFPSKNLSEIEAAVLEAFEKFETDSFTDEDLDRIKARTETAFYNSISSILGKSFQLANYNEYAGSPGFITDDIQRSLDVSKEDILRVYNQYIKGQHYVLTSFVPRGQGGLAVENSELFPIAEETIQKADEDTPKTVASIEVEKIPSSFDRTIEPKKGPTPSVTIPEIWTHDFENGLRLFGIEHNELPLVQFALTIQGGHLLDAMDKVGVANLITDSMMEGTKNKTPLELEEAIDSLGSSIRMSTGSEMITAQVNTLSSRLSDTYGLFEEILLEPRWDEKEFERIKQETIEGINRRNVNPSVVAGTVYQKLVYGPDHIMGTPTVGTKESIDGINIGDLKNYYRSNFSPSVSYITITGNVTKEAAVQLFSPLAEKWGSLKVEFPELPTPEPMEKTNLFFVDVPGAKQSQIRIGHVAIPYTHPDYYATTVMNYKLGGSFNSVVNMILREEKGYTYGARTNFRGSKYPGSFTASAGVQSRFTYESVEIFRDEISKYREGISADDLDFTRSALTQSNALRFETLGALLGMLNNIALYDLPFDYVKQREKIVQDLTVERHQELAQKYIHPDKMIYLVVGDSKTQKDRLGKLGFGKPIQLDSNGNPM